MPDPKLTTIVQVSTFERGGGAAWVAWRLFSEYRRRGFNSYLAVGKKLTGDPDVQEISSVAGSGVWSRRLASLATAVDARAGSPRVLGRALRHLAAPSHWIHRQLGIEDFGSPGTAHIAEMFPSGPDVLHCHNLHGQFRGAGGYFDLRALASLSRRFPVILTLHDAWLFTGHCAHSFECERWRSGCGRCPDLTIYPAIRRDSTAHNWRRKQRIYRESSLFLATPSQWLMEKAKHSILAPAIREARVVPNGVDLAVFRPGNQSHARRSLGLPLDAVVLLSASVGIRDNVFKDYATLKRAVDLVADATPERHVMLVALGDDSPTEQVGRATIRFVPHTLDATVVATYYQAADVYVHAAKIDTFPNTVLEALACGLPVVATSVGGIPEQVKSLRNPALADTVDHDQGYGPNEATGFLVTAGDARAFANAVRVLLDSQELRARLGENGVRDACVRFDLENQVTAYLSWYQQIIEGQQVKEGS